MSSGENFVTDKKDQLARAQYAYETGHPERALESTKRRIGVTITIEQFYNHGLWKEFSKTCTFRVPEGYHWPEDNPYDACTYIDPKTGGGVYTNCCYTSCIAWLDKLSELDRADVLAEMDEGYREMLRLDPSYHKLG